MGREPSEWSGTGRGPSGRYWTGRETLPYVWDGSGTLSKVRNGLSVPPGSPGRVRKPLGRFRTGRWIIQEARDARGGPKLVGGPTGKSGTDRGNLPEVCEG